MTLTLSERLDIKLAKRKAHAELKAQAKKRRITMGEMKMILMCPDPARRARLLAQPIPPKKKRKHEYVNNRPVYYKMRLRSEDCNLFAHLLKRYRDEQHALSKKQHPTLLLNRVRKALKVLNPIR